MEEKPIYRKMLNFITDLKLCSIGLPIICGLPLSAYLIQSTQLGLAWGTLLGFLPWLILFTILTLPIWFIKPTERPSSLQRFCRNYLLGMAKFVSFCGLGSHAGQYIYPQDIRFFQYYLSHPTNPENIWADQVDTTKFDWQNPKEWPF